MSDLENVLAIPLPSSMKDDDEFWKWLEGQLPKDLIAFIRRGPQFKAPSQDRLKAIYEAGPGEHQDRLWALAMKASRKQAEADLHFAIEQHRPEIEKLKEKMVRELLADKLKEGLQEGAITVDSKNLN